MRPLLFPFCIVRGMHAMKTRLALIAWILMAASCARLEENAMPSHAITLHVAPGGADANPGTRAKPFATLERARDEVRALKKAGPLPRGGVAVELAGGVWGLLIELGALAVGAKKR